MKPIKYGKGKMMDKIINVFNGIFAVFGLDKVNEGYVGLTSFEKPVPVNTSRQKSEDDDNAPKTSFTGLLRRVN